MLTDILTDFQEWFLEESMIGDNSQEILLLQDVKSPIDFISISSDLDINFEGDYDNSIAEPFSFDTNESYIETPNLYTADRQSDTCDFVGLGSPVEDAQFWQKQNGSSSCAVVAQTNIFESITGERISEDIACQIAQKNGWFDPEIGTRPGDMGKLLNELGIPTEQKYNATLEDIANALEKGDRVIVGLDANEIWTPLRDANGTPIEQTNAGHAVWITGIDTQPDGSVKILINDSGHPNGKMASVDALDFLNAWEDNSNFLVVADAPDRTVLV